MTGFKDITGKHSPGEESAFPSELERGNLNSVRCPHLINKETPPQIASFSSPVHG